MTETPEASNPAIDNSARRNSVLVNALLACLNPRGVSALIDVYTANTPNGIKVPIALEELGIPYRLIRMNLAAKDQKTPEFLQINPNGRIPAIVDPDGPGGEPLTVFESGAVLLYLAERFGGLLPKHPVERLRAIEYSFFQTGGIGPMFGQAGWFLRSAPERIPTAIARYQDESRRLAEVIDSRLKVAPWLAGSEYSLADIMNFCWLRNAGYAGLDLDDLVSTTAWIETIAARPAVQRGLAVLAG
jgi:GSH-dependent disulfide-bond oxidoreductase